MKARAIPTATRSSSTSTRRSLAAQAAGQPVISVDTKKKELIGNFKNGGTDYRPQRLIRTRQGARLRGQEAGKVVPYGVYDVSANAGLGQRRHHQRHRRVRRRIDPLLARRMGSKRYPDARELTITADCGGSNGARVRLWKVELQKLADETGLTLHVHHYPPGTSKWNKIEHRLFCHITQNWRGRPLVDPHGRRRADRRHDHQTGLKVESALDTRTYEKGIERSATPKMNRLDITGDPFHPEWNYTIRPRRP